MILDGKKISLARQEKIKIALEQKKLTLAIVMVGDDSASNSFVKQKEKLGAKLGVTVQTWRLPADSTQLAVEQLLVRLNQNPQVNGLIIQLPLPQHLVVEAVLAKLSPDKDVDALSPAPRVLSPVVVAIKTLLMTAGVDWRQNKILVLGRGRLVGQPVASHLAELGCDVLVIDRDQLDRPDLLNKFDVLISGLGQAQVIKPNMIKAGAVLIDVGTSEQSGTLVGDFDPACYAKAAAYSPVPGGVGPLVVVELFNNLLQLAEQ